MSKCLFVLALLLVQEAVGRIFRPDFWNTTEMELDELIRQSAPDLASAKRMGGMARECNKLPGYKEEQVYKLTNATVLLLDEPLLCADFPETCSMDRKNKDDWILERSAWFSKPHVDSGLRPIPHEKSRVANARRACQAGRALLLPITDSKSEDAPHWVDVKGTGNPNTKDHSMARSIRNINGLIELQNAIWEFMNEKTVAAVLKHHATHRPQDAHFETVGYYAVLSLGFNIYWERDQADDWVTYPAGGLVRQATRRHPNPYGFMAPKDGSLFEQILNAYGMRRDTKANDVRFANLPNSHCRRVNVQGTILSRQVVDFGELYADPVWPPNECLVHWGLTSKTLDAPLWKETDIGLPRVREFMQRELRELPLIRNETWPAKEMNSARQQRTYAAAEGWWNGLLTIEDVENRVWEGLIDELIDEELQQSFGHSGEEL